ncbi:hypothetical protein [Lacibacter sp. H407]|uniref:hypothetical protein n=1 Tax=Lacibacter sp. H407 TaxID=3133423 RepID=UPI0030C55D04
MKVLFLILLVLGYLISGSCYNAKKMKIENRTFILRTQFTVVGIKNDTVFVNKIEDSVFIKEYHGFRVILTSVLESTSRLDFDRAGNFLGQSAMGGQTRKYILNVIKKSDSLGNRYYDMKLSNIRSFSSDSFYRVKLFKGVDFFDPELYKEVKSETFSDESIVNTYLPTNSTSKEKIDTLRFHFTKRTYNDFISFSTFLEDKQKMKINRVEYSFKEDEVTYSPRIIPMRQMIWELVETEKIPNEEAINRFLSDSLKLKTYAKM